MRLPTTVTYSAREDRPTWAVLTVIGGRKPRPPGLPPVPPPGPAPRADPPACLPAWPAGGDPSDEQLDRYSTPPASTAMKMTDASLRMVVLWLPKP